MSAADSKLILEADDVPRLFTAFGRHNPAFYVLWITIDAAIAAARWKGLGDKVKADQAATQAMRRRFKTVPFAGTICSGEGEKDGMDETGMLMFGEQLGEWGDHDSRVDIAVDPLDGTKLCAEGWKGAVTVIAFGEQGTMAKFPDCKIFKIAVGAEAKGAIRLDKSPVWNAEAVAEAKGKGIRDLNVTVLARPRHDEMIAELRKLGAKVNTISDGDLMPAVATFFPTSGVDMLIGSGGGPEGVIAAAALKCLGGDFVAKVLPKDNPEAARIESMCGRTADHLWSLNDLCAGHCMFAATGVTNGDLLHGVDFESWPGRIITHSLLTRSETHSFYEIKNTKLITEPDITRPKIVSGV